MPHRTLFLAIVLTGCGSVDPIATSQPDPPPPAPAIVSIAALSGDLVVGEQVQLVADVRAAGNIALPNAVVSWGSDRPDVISVSAAGRVQAISLGAATVTASSGAVSGSLFLKVVSLAPASITLSGDTSTFPIGQSRQFSAVVIASTGQVLPNVAVTWRSSNPAVLSLTPSGLVAAASLGTAVITASSGAAQASVTLTTQPSDMVITPQNVQIAIGDSLKLTATLFDRNTGSQQNPALVNWTSSRTDYISVNQGGWAFAHLGPPGAPYGSSVITAAVSGGIAHLSVAVAAITPGLPAGIRFVHAASDLGAITFRPSSGAATSLLFGEVREVAGASGNLRVDVDGFAPLPANSQSYFSQGQSFSGLLPPAQHITFYATGDNPWGILAALWDQHARVAPDSVLVRILYASNYSKTYAGNNLYLLGWGTPIDAHPLLCYVDLAGESTEYVSRAAGGADIVVADPGNFVLTSGNYGTELIRFHVTPTPGRATTYVITGKDPASMSLLTVEDP